MFDTALTWNDLLFLAKGAWMTLVVTGVSVAAGTILGVITIGSGIGSAVGSWAAGWIFDVSGSYRLAFMLSIAAYLCGCVAFWALRRPPVRLSPAS